MTETTEYPTLPLPDEVGAETELTASSLPRPRTRWAGIIWGVALAGVAAFALWTVLDTGRRAGVTEWVLGLTPVTTVTYVILALGAVLFVTGLVGLAHRAQLRFASRGTS